MRTGIRMDNVSAHWTRTPQRLGHGGHAPSQGPRRAVLGGAS